MKTYAAVLVGAMVLLGGCVGGFGGTATDANRQTSTTTASAETSTPAATSTTTETPTPPTTTDVERTVNATFVIEDGENVTVTLMVANEPSERQSGLMHREELANRTGMVFAYENAKQVSFWMKNTLVPLDMIFVAPNGTVLNVEHAEPQPNASTSELETYPSDGQAKYVVELPRGFANRTGVGPGTKLVFEGPVPKAESNGWLPWSNR
ncbi:DUF192 domain-containing protein (plasmid) [Halorussus limi]|uniref:DUF192 domain-containing protein n=1 Tax=Halorussus limi TaxID=2938695 RepID=A0A8U0HZD9_9EURY|nr:DUF192 domain-containing protein [Halorussus limi]UPV76485.1 DUF192 domain-containing protein [Halorussus limi]